MRFFILAVTLIVAFADSAIAQIENPFADVLKTAAEIEVVDSDGRHTTLLKQSFNAAHKEMRIRYNYWLQGAGEIDGLLQSIDRLHKVRLEVGPAANGLTIHFLRAAARSSFIILAVLRSVPLNLRETGN